MIKWYPSAFVLVVMIAGTSALVGTLSCTSDTRVTRVDTEVVTDLSGRWNDTDSRMVAETMIEEALQNPWLEKFTNAHGREPVVLVGRILNRSHEHINVETFIKDLERVLTNARKVSFVAGTRAREDLREERREQAVHAREDTQKRPGKEIGADFMLTGQISSILDESEGVKAVFYQVDLELVDLETNVKSWYGQKKIKKIVERRRFLF